MRPIGFSTGSLARGDFKLGLLLLAQVEATCVELSALRLNELRPLIDALPTLNLEQFNYISLHAPSRFQREDERFIVTQLEKTCDFGWPIVLHADTVHDWALWRRFGAQLCLENMDRRKPIARTFAELCETFEQVPEATFCCDLAHAYQVDPTLSEATKMLTTWRHRLRQIHVSALDAASMHRPMTETVISAFAGLGPLIPRDTPIILESFLADENLANSLGIQQEFTLARKALPLHQPQRALPV